jgi:hypothetical protein
VDHIGLIRHLIERYCHYHYINQAWDFDLSMMKLVVVELWVRVDHVKLEHNFPE